MSHVTTAATPHTQGTEPNTIESQDLYPYMLATVILCSSLTTLFTSLRLFTRWMTSTWALEDYLLSLAWASNLAYDFIFLAEGHIGAGRHYSDVQKSNAVNIAKLSWTLSMIYSPMISLAKSAILLQVTHIFAPTKTGFIYRAAHILIWGNLAFYIGVFFTTIFQCIPQEKIWHPEHTGGHCNNANMAFLISGAFNVLSDLLILLLPLLAIWRLHLVLKRKLGISAVFATGFIAFTSSICRLIYSTRFVTSQDETYVFAQVGMWTLAEIATIILCICFPIMPRFAQLVNAKRQQLQDSSSHTVYPAATSSSGGGGGNPLGFHMPLRTQAWTKRTDTIVIPKKSYVPLGKCEDWKAPKVQRSTDYGGIHRTNSIELVSHGGER